MHSMKYSRLRIICQLLFCCLGIMVLSGGSCGQEEGGPVEPATDYEISKEGTWPDPVVVTQGQSVDLQFRVTRYNNYSKDLTPSLTAATIKVTTVFDPSTMTKTDTVCTVTLNAASDAILGPHNMYLHCEGKTIYFKLLIVPTDGFLFTITPDMLEIHQGGSGEYTINITRYGSFTDPVEFSLNNPPAGYTAQIDPIIAAGNSATLTLFVEPQAALQDRTRSVTGVGGLLNYSSSLRVKVIPPVGWHSVNSTSVRPLHAVSFGDTNTAYAVGEFGTIVKSSDGGQTWTNLSNTGATTNYYGVHFVHPDTGTVVGYGGVILRTTDGGASWTSQGSLVRTLRNVQFLDSKKGFVVGEYGTFAYTRDGGQSWNSANIGIAHDFYALWFHNDSTGVVAGSGGSLFKTTDTGDTWDTIVSYNVTYLDMHFIDGDTGFLTGGPSNEPPYNNEPVMLKTVNGGASWTPLTTGAVLALYGICFLDASTGVAVGANGVIYATTNGGSSWMLESTAPTYMYDVDWVPGQRPIAVGAGGYMMRRDE